MPTPIDLDQMLADGIPLERALMIWWWHDPNGYHKPNPFGEFNCRVCGEGASISFVEPTAHPDFEHSKFHFQAWCESHCPRHEWFNDHGEIRCKWCDCFPPADYYYD